MKKTVSTILLIAIFFSIAAVPAYAEEYSSQTEYTKAKDFVANINFDFFFSSSDLGEDVIADLKNIQDYIMEMSRNVQSGNTQNLKSMVIQRSFPKWSVAERRKTAAASDQAAVCACAHSRYFAGGSPSGLRV